MDPSSSTLILFLILLACSAFSSASETAITTLSPAKVRTLEEQQRRFSSFIARLKKHPEKVLISVLIVNNFVNVWASVIAATLARSYFGSDEVGYVVGFMTFILLIFGEIIPKTLAQRFNVPFAQISSPILYALTLLLYPLIFLLEKFTKTFIWLLGKEKFKSVTEDEVIAMLNIGHEEGEFNKQENEFIQNIFEFSDTTAEQIMVNRNEIEAFPADLNIAKAMKMVINNAHSRMPIFDGTIDNIIGYLTIKDIIKMARSKENQRKKLGDCRLHKILFFPVTKPINKIFKTFQQKRVHIAIILDEFGSTTGLVTIEDVLEEIVGEIVDEFDTEEKPIKKIGKNSYEIEGSTSLEEIFAVQSFDTDVPAHKTLAFLLIKELGAFPREGEKIPLSGQGIEFIVEKMAGKAIQKVKMMVTKVKED